LNKKKNNNNKWSYTLPPTKSFSNKKKNRKHCNFEEEQSRYTLCLQPEFRRKTQLAGTTTTTCFLQQQQQTLKVLADHELH
jgi:hypothetical protein